MRAGVIRSDIVSKKAGTFFAERRFFRKIQGGVQGGFISILGHAAAAVCSINCQFVALSTGTYHHTMFSGNPDHFFSQKKPLFFWHTSHFGKILPYLLIEVNKADDAGFCRTLKACCHVFKAF